MFFKMKEIISTLLIIFCLYNVKVFGLTGGVPTKDGDYPFIASVKDANNCHFMAGTILAAKWILSNAGGYRSIPGGSVSFGSNKLATNETFYYCGPYDTATQRKIDNYYYNGDGWDANPYTHDLVLILLTEPIPLGDNIQPVRLPKGDEPWPFDQTGTMLGWGYEGGEYPGLQTQLQKAEVSIYNDEYCSNSSIWEGYSLFNPAVMKCGGEVQKTYFCEYDYGGPLLINGTQYGIISYAFTSRERDGLCGEYLGIFSPTTTYRDWITNMTGV